MKNARVDGPGILLEKQRPSPFQAMQAGHGFGSFPGLARRMTTGCRQPSRGGATIDEDMQSRSAMLRSQAHVIGCALVSEQIALRE